MGERAPYSRVYWSIVDDTKFATIYDDDRHLATWLRLLIGADAIWPASATLPAGARKASVEALVDAGLIDLFPGRRYRIHGLDAERGRRKDAATTRGPSGTPSGNQTEPKRSPDGPSRAGDAMLGSAQLGSADLGSASAPDAFVAYHSLTGRFPSDGVRDWINELARDHGDADVEEALAAEYAADRSLKTLLSRTESRLELEAHNAEKRRQEAEARHAEEERQRIESMPPEQRSANLARLGEMMAERGLLPRREEGKPA